jgi:hypothetical protein
MCLAVGEQEHNDLASTLPDVVEQLLQRAAYWDAQALNISRGGDGTRQLCCEYMTAHRGYAGPYMP